MEGSVMKEIKKRTGKGGIGETSVERRTKRGIPGVRSQEH